MELFLAFRDVATAESESVAPAVRDSVLDGFAAIVGKEWVSNDPAHLSAYARVRSPKRRETLPRYVVLPGSASEVAALVKRCNEMKLPYVARGSGTSLEGATTTGVVMDLTRMNWILIDEDNWSARIGPGALAFDVQKAAYERKLRANVAEPAACVCANIITTNMHSLFSLGYGLGADHVVEAEFVDEAGEIVTTRDTSGPNPYQFRQGPSTKLGICTGMSIRLFPRTEDEEAILVPFDNLTEATKLARTLAERHIGVGMGVFGSAYMAMFAGQTGATAKTIRQLLEDDLGIVCFLLAIGDKSALEPIRKLAAPILDQQAISKLLRGLPNLDANPTFATLMDAESGDALYKTLFSEEMRPLLHMTLESGGEDFGHVPDNLREFYRQLYSREELVDPVWLNTFRILPARMGRGHQFASQIAWITMRPPDAVQSFSDELQGVANQHGVTGAFGYLVPIDHGTRAIVEYDFYFDAAIDAEKQRVCDALVDAAACISTLSEAGIVRRRGASLVGQGMSRYQSYLFTQLEAP
jgi:hypothetical protein